MEGETTPIPTDEMDNYHEPKFADAQPEIEPEEIDEDELDAFMRDTKLERGEAIYRLRGMHNAEK
jgi:hypothetical protein